jgi:hypothetical protein
MKAVKRVVNRTVPRVVEATADGASFNLFAGCRSDTTFAETARHDECGAAHVHLSIHGQVQQTRDARSS